MIIVRDDQTFFQDDEPIFELKNDLLGRKNFVKHLGSAISNWKKDQSIIISVCGEWGSGKTSAINLMLEHLKPNINNSEFIVLHFKPWCYSSNKRITAKFFDELINTLNLDQNVENKTQLLKKLKKYNDILCLAQSNFQFIKSWFREILLFIGISSSTISHLFTQSILLKNFFIGIGLASIFLALFKDFLGSWIQTIENILTNSNKPLNEVKNDIVKILSDQKRKVLIIIDDIDRLHPDEIVELLKLIRENADFPNTIYLLSFDRMLVEKMISAQLNIPGNKYLEKIVQVIFDLPSFSKEKLDNLLFQETYRIIGNFKIEQTDLLDSYLAEIFHSGLFNLFQNMRDVKRFINSYEFNIALINQNQTLEVNPVDLLALEIIRLFVPEFYLFMKHNQEIMTDFDTPNSESELFCAEQKKAINDEMSKLPAKMKKITLESIKTMFPQIASLYREGMKISNVIGDKLYSESYRSMRICCKEFYPSYFTLIPGGDEVEVSQYEINKFIHYLSDQEKIHEFVIQLLKVNKLGKLISKINPLISDAMFDSENKIQQFLVVLFDVMDSIPKDNVFPSFLGIENDLSSLVYQLMKRVSEKERFEMSKNLIMKSKSIYAPIMFLNDIFNSSQQNPYSSMFSNSEKNELDAVCLQKLNQIDIEQIKSNFRLMNILWYWRKTGNGWEKIISTLDDDPKEKLEFICNNFTRKYAPSRMRLPPFFELDGMSKFFDLQKTFQFFKEIPNKNPELYAEFKEFVVSYTNQYNEYLKGKDLSKDVNDL